MRQQITVWVKADEVAVQLHKQKGLGRAQPEGIPTAIFFSRVGFPKLLLLQIAT